jgi:phage tail sheath protein FI
VRLRPGIIIQHARETSPDTGLVRSDIAGFIGVVPRARWPQEAQIGDFFEFPLETYADLLKSPARHVFDPVTRRAVRSFFENGGLKCILFGLCVDSEADLLVDDPFDQLFHPLLDRLRGEEDIGLIAMPVLAYLPVARGRNNTPIVRCQPVMDLLLSHCEEMNNRFLILDTPRDLHENALSRWVRDFREANSTIASYGAIYYPWLMAGDEMFPPSGSVAGVFARLDKQHEPFGVRWPPANEVIRGVTHPMVPLRFSEAGDFADLGVNPILTEPARGVVIWGARTLSKDPRWLHINSRRIVSYISEQLRRDNQWVVFENHRPELWDIVSRGVRSRLDQLWTAGLLSGDRAGSEYLVQCDRETNPPEVVNAGQVNVKVLLRPISTTENIVVELRLG